MTTSNGFASKADLLHLSKRRYRDVEIAGMKVRIQSLMESERAELDAIPYDEKTGKVTRQGLAAVRPMTIAKCLVNSDGHRIFDDSDVDAIRAMDGTITDALFDACRDHCNIELAQFEDLVKNSSGTHGDGSHTDSH